MLRYRRGTLVHRDLSTLYMRKSAAVVPLPTRPNVNDTSKVCKQSRGKTVTLSQDCNVLSEAGNIQCNHEQSNESVSLVKGKNPEPTI